jgi:uncharacterized membrane protein
MPGREAVSTIRSSVHRNVLEICKLESESLRRRSLADRLADWVVYQFRQSLSITLHAVWFLVWIVWNTHAIPQLKPFDPYPFSLLTTTVSLEAIFLSLFILMTQDRTSRQTEQRAHLDLQINLLAEHESTKTLQLLHALCLRHGIDLVFDPELRELMSVTHPADILRELQDKLPTV